MLRGRWCVVNNTSDTSGLTLAQRILVRATELIGIKENWIKGSGFSNDKLDRYCALGAIRKAALIEAGLPVSQYSFSGMSDATSSAIRDVDTIVRSQLTKAIHTYNDYPATTHEDIKAVFCRAVKKELVDVTDNANSDDKPAA